MAFPDQGGTRPPRPGGRPNAHGGGPLHYVKDPVAGLQLGSAAVFSASAEFGDNKLKNSISRKGSRKSSARSALARRLANRGRR